MKARLVNIICVEQDNGVAAYFLPDGTPLGASALKPAMIAAPAPTASEPAPDMNVVLEKLGAVDPSFVARVRNGA